MENTNNSASGVIMKPVLPGVLELLGQAINNYNARLPLVAGIFAVPFVFGILTVIASMRGSGSGTALAIIAGLAGFFANLALLSVISRNDNDTVKSAYDKGLQMVFPALWVTLLVGLSTMGGLFLLVIPAIPVSLWLSSSMYVLFDENRRGTSALVQSWHYTKGYAGAIFLRILFVMLITSIITMVLASITYGTSLPATLMSAIEPGGSWLGQIVTLFLENFIISPITIIYLYGIYVYLKKIKEAQQMTEPEEQKIRRNIKFLSILGLVGIAFIIIFVGRSLIPLLPQF